MSLGRNAHVLLKLMEKALYYYFGTTVLLNVF